MPSAISFSMPPRLATLAALSFMGLLGCREDLTAPTAPESPPVLATAATTALVFYQVSAGWQHTCGVTTDHRAYCWGSNSQGAPG
jgi:alpha-tubulin suppressor-like RCC1 family protein